MSSVKSYADLQVWQYAMDLIPAVYRITRQLPLEERFGMASQLQRATVSIAANIAEGHARDHTREYMRHLSIAKGSLAEVETLLHAAERVGYTDIEQTASIFEETATIGRMLSGLQRSLRSRLDPNP